MRSSRWLASVSVWLMLTPTALLGQVADRVQSTAQETGVSALWILANLSFAGMRAQGHPSVGWRLVSFILGLPGTLLTVLVVTEGGERAYGVDLPRSARSGPGQPSELRFVERD